MYLKRDIQWWYFHTLLYRLMYFMQITNIFYAIIPFIILYTSLAPPLLKYLHCNKAKYNITMLLN